MARVVITVDEDETITIARDGTVMEIGPGEKVELNADESVSIDGVIAYTHFLYLDSEEVPEGGDDGDDGEGVPIPPKADNDDSGAKATVAA